MDGESTSGINKKEWYSPSRLASWVNQVAYIFLMNLIRTSILVSYLQFFTTRGYRVTTWFLIDFDILDFSNFGLHLPVQERIVLMFLMSLGLTACIASAVKTAEIYRAILLTYDVPWEGYNVWLMCAVEINLAMISPSIPVLRPLVQKYFPKLGFRPYQNMSGRTASQGMDRDTYRIVFKDLMSVMEMGVLQRPSSYHHPKRGWHICSWKHPIRY
ncbi:uncharacterized protein CIMG_00583 [Coccidioides immitis RS]|uniref:Rhodopsin domain-containing protein n=1 Tax=Coccidioides immitis (strain RS) TaxID=246410 RepID=J3KHB4_COCIM|nr:uncharacterized protein CIMG_00583 [Coccidioides immitis RS]EAS35229.3 hypothetical protein CIMG_00583 [Coccidioides immitis RS]